MVTVDDCEVDRDILRPFSYTFALLGVIAQLVMQLWTCVAIRGVDVPGARTTLALSPQLALSSLIFHTTNILIALLIAEDIFPVHTSELQPSTT